MKKFIIYTDGACSNNQKKINEGGWAAVILDSNENPVKNIWGHDSNTSNNKMEMTAIIKGLHYVKKEYLKEKRGAIDVFTDSAYIVNCFVQKWYKKWRKNGWKTSNGKSVKNKKLWMALLSLVERTDLAVRILKVEGHSGDFFNERADKLAVAAIKNEK